jgi:hypothetical protein
VSTPTTKPKVLGRFLRLAEFADTTPYEDLYRAAGGQEANRDSFMRSLVRRGFIEIEDDGAVQLTARGREESRRMIQGKGL